MKNLGTVTLETERLILRRPVMDDAEAMLRNWANDPEVTKYLTWPPHKNLDVTREYIAERNGDREYNWLIELKSLGEPIGSISAVKSRPEIGMVHIGYCIGRSWWHTGITSEAFTEVIRFFFEEVDVNRIEACHDPLNGNSGKVMQKCGLKYEGTMRQADISNQGICDISYYAILKEDYFG